MDHKQIVSDIDKLAMKKLLDILRNNSKDKIPMSDYIKTSSSCSKILSSSNSEPVKYLFDYLINQIKSYCKDIYKSLNSLVESRLVDAFYDEVSKFKIFLAWLNKLFMALENHRNVTLGDDTLIRKGLIQFKEIILNPMKSNIFGALNYVIILDRNCASVDRQMIFSVIKFIEQLDLEDPIIENGDIKGRILNIKPYNVVDPHIKKHSASKKYLLKEWLISQYEDLKLYAHEKATREIQLYSAPEYIKSSLKYFQEEDSRYNTYFPSESLFELKKINADLFIKQRLEALSKMETGVSYMFQNNKQEELKAVYGLYNRLGDTAIKMINTDMSVYIKDTGNTIFNNKDISKDPTKFVPELLKLKLHMDNLVEICFGNHLKIVDAKAKAFTSFMGKEHYSKQLALFCDFLMKVGLRGKNENQTEDELNNVMNLFKCISNKLVFQVEYAKKLSERLISNRTISAVAEKNLIAKIKADQGVAYTNRMTNMFEDLDKSVANVDDFRREMHKGKIGYIILSCQILQNGAWEIDESKYIKVDLTPKLKECIKKWEEFYKKKYSAHKLIWANGVVSNI